MPNVDLHGFRVAALVSDRFEESELVEPKQALEEVGAKLEILSSKSELEAMRPEATVISTVAPALARSPLKQEAGGKYRRDHPLDQARAADYDALLLPGGIWNSDRLRIEAAAQRFAREIVQAEKPVAFIGHGGWLLISSGLVAGRKLTSQPAIQADYLNAGAQWVDEEVVVDRRWISSRKPDDLTSFNSEMLRVFAESRHAQAA